MAKSTLQNVPQSGLACVDECIDNVQHELWLPQSHIPLAKVPYAALVEVTTSQTPKPSAFVNVRSSSASSVPQNCSLQKDMGRSLLKNESDLSVHSKSAHLDINLSVMRAH